MSTRPTSPPQHTPSRRLRSAALLLAVATVLSGCTLGLGENNPGGGAINIETLPLIEPQARDAGPEVCGETLDEDALCLADLQGSPTLVNFWASWCGPCATEVPQLVDIAETYEGTVDLVGVNLADSVVNARSFERDQQVNYPSLVDHDATIAAAFGGIAPSALPSTFLLDAQGRVALRLFGAVTATTLQPYLDALVAEG